MNKVDRRRLNLMIDTPQLRGLTVPFFYISLKTFGPMETQTVIVIFAIAATFGLVTVVAIDIILTAQEAEAAGCRRPGE
jgi:hypothetical protein